MSRKTPKEKAAASADGPLEMARIGAISGMSINPHPEPSGEPVMPVEVFYNRLALGEDPADTSEENRS